MRQKQLSEYKENLIKAKAEERKEDLLRTTFMKMNTEEIKAQENINEEKER